MLCAPTFTAALKHMCTCADHRHARIHAHTTPPCPLHTRTPTFTHEQLQTRPGMHTQISNQRSLSTHAHAYQQADEGLVSPPDFKAPFPRLLWVDGTLVSLSLQKLLQFCGLKSIEAERSCLGHMSPLVTLQVSKASQALAYPSFERSSALTSCAKGFGRKQEE